MLDNTDMPAGRPKKTLDNALLNKGNNGYNADYRRYIYWLSAATLTSAATF